MSIFEYDQERHMQQEREAGIEKGRRQGEEQLLRRLVQKNLSRGNEHLRDCGSSG